MSVLFVAVGSALIVAALVDLVWTTVAAGSGAGPLAGRLARRLWQLALARHRRRTSHRLLSTAGVLVVLAVLGAWITLAFTGWVLVFSATDGAVRATDSGEPAGLVDRIYFAGYVLFTLGNGGYSPGAGTWQVATVLATGTGLVLVTLAITYLVPVASAVAQRRQLASYIASLGADPTDIVTRSWTGSGFGSLSQHFVALTQLMHGAGQHHLAYPVLHYFHSRDRESAAALNIANLAQALHLLRHGVAGDARPDPAAVGALDSAVGSFLDTLSSAYIAPGDEALHPPPLEPLRQAGIATVGDADYDAAAATTERRRRLLAALVRDDGWAPSERSTTP